MWQIPVRETVIQGKKFQGKSPIEGIAKLILKWKLWSLEDANETRVAVEEAS
jgi:hypothetical protein